MPDTALPSTLQVCNASGPRVRGALARRDGTLAYTVVGRARGSNGHGYTVKYHAAGRAAQSMDLAREVITFELALALCTAHWALRQQNHG